MLSVYFETVLNVLTNIFAVQARMNVHHVFQQIDLTDLLL